MHKFPPSCATNLLRICTSFSLRCSHLRASIQQKGLAHGLPITRSLHERDLHRSLQFAKGVPRGAPFCFSGPAAAALCVPVPLHASLHVASHAASRLCADPAASSVRGSDVANRIEASGLVAGERRPAAESLRQGASQRCQTQHRPWLAIVPTNLVHCRQVLVLRRSPRSAVWCAPAANWNLALFGDPARLLRLQRSDRDHHRRPRSISPAASWPWSSRWSSSAVRPLR